MPSVTVRGPTVGVTPAQRVSIRRVEAAPESRRADPFTLRAEAVAHDHRTAAPRRAPPPRRGTLYRGREGMWSWVAHRITGVLIFFFLFVHVLDTALVRVSPDAYDEVIATYKTPIVNLMEVGLVGAVLFHALNGLRIIAVDFWAEGPALPEADALGDRGRLAAC